MVYRHVWRHGIRGGGVVLQAGHKVRHRVCFRLLAIADDLGVFFVSISIQNWALKEAKQRMEARGEKVEYKPSSS